MLDYLTEGIAFWMTLFGVQESLLEFRLGYLGRYWFLAISASLLIGFLLSAPITITLIIKFAVDPFTWTGNVILCAIAEVIFGVILSLSQGYKGTKNFNYTIQYSYNFIVANYTVILFFHQADNYYQNSSFFFQEY